MHGLEVWAVLLCLLYPHVPADAGRAGSIVDGDEPLPLLDAHRN